MTTLVIHTLEVPTRQVGTSSGPAPGPGAAVVVSWVWTRGDGIWWCRACRCRVLYARCTNTLCRNN